MVNLKGCIYAMYINNKPYVGQSRVLDKDNIPTKRWKRHIADSKTSDTYLYRAIRKYGVDRKEVIEYIDYECDSSPIVASNIIRKSQTNTGLKKYSSILKCMLKRDCEEDEAEENVIECGDISDVTKKEAELLTHIHRFIELLNIAEEKWITEFNSMMPERGGIGYNSAPAGGVLLHEPHTEEHKKYMSELMKGRIISEETKKKLSEARKGKPTTEAHKKSLGDYFEKKFKDTIFPTRLSEWNEQYKKKGKLPDCNSTDLDEKRAGQWRQDMIAKRFAPSKSTGRKLTEEQIKILEDTPGWTWGKSDEFVEQFENFKTQYIKYDGKLTRGVKDAEHINRHKASLWVNAMRVKKRNNHPYLTPERIKMLDECEFWSWIPTTIISFDDRIDHYKMFYDTNKKLPSMGSDSVDERKLARWVIRMRMDYHNKESRMTDEKIKQLAELPGWLWSV
jgi:hypothetical protein